MARRKKNDDGIDQIELGDRPPSAYSLNGDIAGVADELIGRHDIELGHLRNFKLAFQRRDSTREDETWNVDGVAQSWVGNDRERGLHGFEGGVWIRGLTWDRLDPSQRRALLLHHLLHFQITPRYALKRVGHDVEEFALVARVYGAWEEQLQLFDRAIEDHTKGAPERSISERRMEEERQPSPLRSVPAPSSPATH